MATNRSVSDTGAKARQTSEEPPPYAAAAPQTTEPRSSPAVLTSSDFDISYKEKGDGKTTVVSHVLSHDPSSLRQYIKAQARNIHTPLIRVRGTHRRAQSESMITVVDFDFWISMRDLFPVAWRRSKVVPNGWSTYRGTRTMSDSPPGMDLERNLPVPSLGDWCRGFCVATWVPREFTIAHQPIFYGSEELYDSIKQAIQGSKYVGNISITWSAEYNNTVVTSDHWMTCLRMNPVVWWICIIFQLWVLTWPLLWVLTRRWTILTIEHPNRVFPSSDGSWQTWDEDDRNVVQEGVLYQGAKVIMTGEAWVDKWKNAIVRSALAKRQNFRIRNPSKDDTGRPWEPLGNFNETTEWGRNE